MTRLDPATRLDGRVIARHLAAALPDRAWLTPNTVVSELRSTLAELTALLDGPVWAASSDVSYSSPTLLPLELVDLLSEGLDSARQLKDRVSDYLDVFSGVAVAAGSDGLVDELVDLVAHGSPSVVDASRVGRGWSWVRRWASRAPLLTLVLILCAACGDTDQQGNPNGAYKYGRFLGLLIFGALIFFAVVRVTRRSLATRRHNRRHP